jgi:prepilin-type N-terminal cleavage/methylation domain-containing protein
MKIITKKQKGFTLIEVLVALTIFMIFIISITRSYLDIAQSQREANAVREIYSEIRYVYSLIAEEARSKTIDYGCPRSPESGAAVAASNACTGLINTVPENFLPLINADGTERTVFKAEEDSETGEKTLFMAKETFTGEAWEPAEGYGAGNNYMPIDLKYIRFTGLVFEISPLADPFADANIACGPVQFQPSVSVYSNIEGVQGNVSDFNLDLQTTISSRVYNRQTEL